MASTVEKTASPDSSIENQPWLTFLTKESSSPRQQKWAIDVLNILKEFLSDSKDASETAKKIDNYTMFRSPTREHLLFTFQTIYDLAAFIPYEDPKQEKLMQLIAELLKMPRRSWEVADGKTFEEGPVYYNINMEAKHDMWNARHVDAFFLDQKSQDEYTQACTEWINLSAFYARCIAAGLDDHDDQACKFPGCDIPEALEPEYDYYPGIDTDFRVMVATNYIIISGEDIRNDNVKWWDEHAPIWEKKLEELEDWYENGFPEVVPKFETPPGEKELIGTGDLGMDVLGSVKAAKEKLKELRERALEQESKENVDTLDSTKEVADKKDE